MSKIQKLVLLEEKRQEETISLVPSENYASKAVHQALGSVLTNKYAEGYPNKRYYPGNLIVDDIESQAQNLALKLFGLSSKRWHANVQPYSGSPANFAVYTALLAPKDKLMGLSLGSGGHLSHGHRVSSSGIFFRSVRYDVGKNGLLDYDTIAGIAKKEKPKLIIAGLSSYPRKLDFKKFSLIAKSVGAYLMADIAHIAGLVSVGLHLSPFPYADVVTFTTHKNFHGPRGGVIICKKDLAEKIDRAVFPVMQGGPHMNQIAAAGVAFEEAIKPAFKKYQKQVLKNTQVLAAGLQRSGFQLFTGGTDSHLFVVDCAASGIDASVAEKKLEQIGILANRNALPKDEKPYRPSGLRFGTHAATTRGMKENEMQKLATIITDTLLERRLSKVIATEVRTLAKKFPIT